jgi:general secretion pathway protein G
MAFRIATGNRGSTSGFTLIELLVVMAIIGSLLTIAAPRYFRSLERSREVVLAQDLAVMREAIDQFFGDRGVYPDALETLAVERYVRRIPEDPITKSAETWTVVMSTDRERPGVVDVHSGSEKLARDGTPYNAW